MTLVAAMVVEGLPFIGSVFMAADSRVNFYTDSNKMESYTDRGHKIIELNERLVIAYAGDFYHANLAIQDINVNDINNENETFNIANAICQTMNKFWKREFFETDFFLSILDSRSTRWILYKFNSQSFIPRPLPKGLHLIGMDDEIQNQFRQVYNETIKDLNPPNIESLYSISFSNAFNRCLSQDVNGVISYYILKSDGISRSGLATLADGENHWIAHSPNKDGTSRFINGVPFGSTTTDFKRIKDNSKKFYKDKSDDDSK